MENHSLKHLNVEVTIECTRLKNISIYVNDQERGCDRQFQSRLVTIGNNLDTVVWLFIAAWLIRRGHFSNASEIHNITITTGAI